MLRARSVFARCGPCCELDTVVGVDDRTFLRPRMLAGHVAHIDERRFLGRVNGPTFVASAAGVTTTAGI